MSKSNQAALPLSDQTGSLSEHIAEMESTQATQSKQEEHMEVDLRGLIENVQDVIVRYNLNLRYVYASPSLERFLGIKSEKLIGKSHSEVGFSEDLCRFFDRSLQQVIVSRSPLDVEFSTTSLGIEYFLESRVYPEFDDQGRVKSIVTITRDVTRRKLAEDAIRKNQANLSALAENTDDIVWSVDATYQLISGNAAFLSTMKIAFGAEIEQGKCVLVDNLPQSTKDEWREYYDRALRGERFNVESQTQYSSNQRYITYRFQPITIGDEIVGVVVSGRDITERKHAEELLRLTQFTMDHITDSILFVTHDAKIIYANNCTCRNWGYKPEEILGRRVYELDTSYTVENWNTQWDELKKRGHVMFHTTYKAKDNGFRIVEATADHMVFGDHSFGCVLIRDITERRHAEEALRESEEKFRGVYTQSPAGIEIFDAEGKLLDINPSGLNFFGIERAEDIHGFDIFSDPNITRELRERLAAGEPIAFESAFNFELVKKLNLYPTSKSGRCFIDCLVTPLKSPSGSTTGYLVHVRDITQRKIMEDELHESRQQYLHLFEGIGDAIIIHDFKGDMLDFNPAAPVLYGYTREEFISLEGTSLIHPSQIPKLENQLASLLANQVVVTETIHLHKDGHAIPVEVGARYIEFNHTPAFLTVIRDITEREKMARALEESEKRFRALIEHSMDAITLIDADARVVYESPSVSLLTGYTLDERMGRSGFELVHPDDLPMVKQTLSHVLTHAGSVRNAQFRSVKKDGTVRWTEGSAINLLDEPSVQAIVINYRDITDRKKAEVALKSANKMLNGRVAEVERLQSELREQALRDPLTGLYNRRYLSATMERELSRAKREKKPISVIVMDIDHFKKINDNFGHQVGDQFLIEISNRIASHARSSDITCRYGGEEFLLVMPGATMKTAMKRAEAIRRECADVQITNGKKQLKVTLSLGVATFPKHGTGAEEIVIKADKAMYKAKRAGRNCVTAWE